MLYRKTTYGTFVSIIVLQLLFNSCEKELLPDMSNVSSKIVMNGILSPDSLIEVEISKSYSYFLSGQSPELKQEALLKLYVNGEYKETMQRAEKKNTKGWRAPVSFYRATIRPGIGDKIRIEASVDGFESVWAETTIPAPILIEKVDTATFFTQKQLTYNYAYLGDSYGYGHKYYEEYADSIKMEPQYRNMRLKVKVKSGRSSSVQNFYLGVNRMQVASDTAIFYERRLASYTYDDPIFTKNPKKSILNELFGDDSSSKSSPIFSDRLFKNDTYALNFSVSGYYISKMTFEEHEVNEYHKSYRVVDVKVLNPAIEVQIWSISDELKPYFTGTGLGGYSDEGFSDISEPSTTYSNVHNGIGIVGAISIAKKQIEIEPYPGGINTFPR